MQAAAGYKRPSRLRGVFAEPAERPDADDGREAGERDEAELRPAD